MDEGTKRFAMFLAAITIVITGAYTVSVKKSSNLVEIAKAQAEATVALANIQACPQTNVMQGKDQEDLESLLDGEASSPDEDSQAGIQPNGSLKLF